MPYFTVLVLLFSAQLLLKFLHHFHLSTVRKYIWWTGWEQMTCCWIEGKEFTSPTSRALHALNRTEIYNSAHSSSHLAILYGLINAAYDRMFLFCAQLPILPSFFRDGLLWLQKPCAEESLSWDCEAYNCWYWIKTHAHILYTPVQTLQSNFAYFVLSEGAAVFTHFLTAAKPSMELCVPGVT